MSTNFTGVTFAEQKITPTDDAIVRRAILPDGILTGCGLSYSGSTLTMAAGQLMVCGRQIRHPSRQNWAVVDAINGYARLLLTIDMTRTATKDTFDQVQDTIEYASSADGFPDLEQADINGSGTRYQIVACIVSLGTGGITGIVSQLGKSVADGSGGLNFKLVGGLTQPSDPSENMIWVNTEEPITAYTLSPEEPSGPVNGMVWILTGTTSPVAFNALKKNAIQVCPISAKQYIGGIWQTVTAKSYQNGKWADWFDGYLYNAGDECEFYTGGWESAWTSTDYYTSKGSVTKNADTLELKAPEGRSSIFAKTVNKIDVTDFTKLTVTATTAKGKFGLSTGAAWNVSNDMEVNATPANGEASLDISNMTGEYYICMYIASSASIKYSKVKIE